MATFPSLGELMRARDACDTPECLRELRRSPRSLVDQLETGNLPVNCIRHLTDTAVATLACCSQLRATQRETGLEY